MLGCRVLGEGDEEGLKDGQLEAKGNVADVGWGRCVKGIDDKHLEKV